MRRRVQSVRLVFTLLKGLMPECFLNCKPTLFSFREELALCWVLPTLREIAAIHLPVLPPPLGFRPPLPPAGESKNLNQQRTGPDPPQALP